MIGGRIKGTLKGIIAVVVRERGAWLVEMQTVADHVHLLVEVDPQFGVHRLVTSITEPLVCVCCVRSSCG